MAAQDVKNFDRMHKMNRILQWKRAKRSVKLGNTVSGAHAAGQIVSKSFSMKDLKNNQRSGQSNPVKVNQSDVMSQPSATAGHSCFVIHWALELGHSSFYFVSYLRITIY